ncbi:MAG: hypothetical protein U1F76_14950 [Candidatus Competibacteraceae bacterium]
MKMKLTFELISWHKIDSSHRLMTLIVITLGLLNLFFGEKVPAGNGLGWDGVTYAYMVRHLDSIIPTGELSPYYAHRILAPAIVHGMLKISGAAFTDFNIIRAFEIYNLILLIIATRIWKRIADVSSLSLTGRWLGFAGLFLSFMGSKLVFYYPVLTDVTALFLGLLSLQLYLEKRTIPLFFTSLVGAFAWPLVSICGAILLIFMWSKPSTNVIVPQSSRFLINRPKFWRLLLFGWIVLLVLSISGFLILSSAESYFGVTKLAGINISIWKRGLTGLPSLTGVFIGLAILVGSALYFQSMIADLRNTRLLSWVLAILIFLIPSIIFYKIQSAYIPGGPISNPGNLTLRGTLSLLLIAGQPGKFLLPFVSLVVFWGPVVLLLLLTWKTFCCQARALGAGFVGVVALILPLGLATEPRFITFAWPFFVLGAALALESTEKTITFKYAFVVLVILYGQFWMKLNLAPWTGDDYELLLEYPKQIYFMHVGMRMNWWSYSLQFIAVILSALWLRKTINTAPGIMTSNLRSMTMARTVGSPSTPVQGGV